MNKRASFAAFNMAIAVALGALAAHFLKEHLSANSLASFQTGVRYHIYHSIALLVLAVLPVGAQKLRKPWFLMAIGMLFFSVSIYGLSLQGLLFPEHAMSWLGPVTPLGGLMLITAWVWMGIRFLRCM